MLNQIAMLRTQKKGAIPAAILGLLMCLGAVVLLWTNEGRTDLSTIARQAAIISADSNDTAAKDQLVSITGRLEVDGPPGDELGVGGDYLALVRTAEMYAWSEHKEGDDDYSYEAEWTSTPQDSSQFHTHGLVNPPMGYTSCTIHARGGRVGSYTFDPDRATLPAPEPIVPAGDLSLPANGRVAGSSIYLYAQLPASSQPVVGDVRLNYSAVPAGGVVTLFGKLAAEQQVEPYLLEGQRLYGIWAGNHDEALAAMHSAYVFQGWAMRIGGFMMMFLGLNLIVQPLTALLGAVPILGQVGRGLLWGINFVIALVLSLAIILVSFIAHRWYLLLGLFLLAAAVITFLVYRRRRRAPAKG